MVFETRIARRVSLAVERKASSAWIRRGGHTRLRGIPAWAIMAILGVIALSPIVASALPPSGTVVVSATHPAGWTVQIEGATLTSTPTATTAIVTVLGTWQTWNALVGGWWNINAGFFGPPLTTISSYVAAHPGARIMNRADGAGGVRIAAGYGAGAWDNFVGNVDAFTIGVGAVVTNYDFEPGAGPAHLDIGSNGVVEFDFPTIQAAVNAANSGDTVLVDPGAYSEVGTITKTLTR